MSQYVQMAEEIRKNSNGKNIDEYIEKYASDKGLNNNEKQRLIEEYNIGSFLDKLAEGTQHEDFDVANPIVTHSKGSKPVLEAGELNKAASENFVVSSDMFSFDNTEVVSVDEMLPKTASVNEDSFVMNSEEKWENQEKERMAVFEEYGEGLAKTAMEDEIYSNLGELTRIVNESEGMTKTAVAAMSMSGLDDLAISMLENSKFSSKDILESDSEPLKKEAASKIKEIAVKSAKNLPADAWKAVKGAKDVAAFPVKHPLVTLVGAGGLMYANSDRMDKADRDRMDMSLRNYRNEPEY